MMKKFFTVTLAGLTLVSSMGITAFAEPELQANVYVTISDKDKKLALKQEKITVTDIDNDNQLTINDALFAAHETKYEGGAKAGYEAYKSEYGISLNKLWGTANGGSYGYYVNHKSAWNLTDTIKEGDYVNAFVYTDLTAYSDKYSYFNVNTVTGKQNEEISLILSMEGYDAEYKPITIPVEGAVITLNGKNTDYKTDKDGKVTIKISDVGTHVISAVSDTLNLLPPVCKAEVEKEQEIITDETTIPETTTQENNTTEEITTSENNTTEITQPVKENVEGLKTGDSTNIRMVIFLCVVSFISVFVISIYGKKTYEE